VYSYLQIINVNKFDQETNFQKAEDKLNIFEFF